MRRGGGGRRAKLSAWLAVLGLGALLLAAPARAGEADEPEKSLFVAAPSSLRDAVNFMARAFQHKSLTEVTRTYGGSFNLRRQVEAGAPFDVFMTSQASMLEEMAKEGRITESRPIATNSLVLIVPATSKNVPRTLADLQRPEFTRIAAGQPDYTPAGQYVKDVLEAADLWDKLEKRFVWCEDTRQALARASQGDVDAAFVYRTDARGSKTVRVALDLPPVPGKPITFGAGVTVQAADPALAKEFLDFMLSREGQAILAQYGFGPAPEATASPAPAKAPAAAPPPAATPAPAKTDGAPAASPEETKPAPASAGPAAAPAEPPKK